MITLKTLADATAQEVFDQAAIHLLTQNAKSQMHQICCYRGIDGRKCAAGCLIGDDEMANITNTDDWASLVRSEKVPPAHEKIILALQRVHDTLDVEMWRKGLVHEAKRFGLNTDAIDNFRL